MTGVFGEKLSMHVEILKGRTLKKQIERLLGQSNLREALNRICLISARRAVNPLFSLLYHHDPLLRWRAVSALGRVVSHQAGSDMDAARIVMRRLMWNLNDESGGIGWGSPEAMGEIMACSRLLAQEYAHILVSYIDPRGNYLEHDLLQQGVLWGLGRLFHARPASYTDCAGLIIPFLEASDSARRGLAAWALAPLSAETARKPLLSLTGDTADICVYIDQSLEKKTVGALAQEALGFYRESPSIA